MFCPKCGVELPDDSQFCRKCGSKFGAKPSVRTGYVVALLVVFFVGFGLVIYFIRSDAKATQQTKVNASSAPSVQSVPQPASPPPPQAHSQSLGNKAFTVRAGSFQGWAFVVPDFAKQVRVQGRFAATGGARNDVEVYVLGKNEFTNWSNGNPTNTFYNSGRATVGDLNVALPDGFGQYYLVFNNKFSLLTPKAVEFDGTMTYYQ
jgi:zinc-ribbon domain